MASSSANEPLSVTKHGWVALLALGVGCTHGMDHDEMMGVPEVIEQAPWAGTFETTAAADLDPADDVVEVELEAQEADIELAADRVVRLWTYNGVLPGPRIEARVGDTVRVHFRNSLPESTTIHWHGLRIANAMDGVPAVQSAIEPGDEFTYEFVVPDAGTFWYHPHLRSDEQVERGLYGSIVVRGAAEPETDSDRVVVLDDILVDPRSFHLEPFDTMMQGMVGRQGNLILANGRAHPIAELASEGLHRFRFVNAANARYFRLAAAGQRFQLIGTDGGLLEAPRDLDELLLVPGERADVVMATDGPVDSTLEWETLPYERGHGTGRLPRSSVFQVRLTPPPETPAPALPAELDRIAALDAPTVRRRLELGESMDGGHSGHSGGAAMGAVFSINGRVYPDIRPITAALGAVEEWSVVNTTGMDHPFHLHGFRFQVSSDDDGPAPFPAWRDTVNVRAESTTRLLVSLDGDSGTWMFHCHILEHAERGMMGELMVE